MTNKKDWRELLPKSAKDWQMFHAIGGVDRAVQDLNTHLAALMEKARRKISYTPVSNLMESVYDDMLQYASKYDKYGIYDTEPRYVLRQAIRKVFALWLFDGQMRINLRDIL